MAVSKSIPSTNPISALFWLSHVNPSVDDESYQHIAKKDTDWSAETYATIFKYSKYKPQKDFFKDLLIDQ